MFNIFIITSVSSTTSLVDYNIHQVRVRSIRFEEGPHVIFIRMQNDMRMSQVGFSVGKAVFDPLAASESP